MYNLTKLKCILSYKQPCTSNQLFLKQVSQVKLDPLFDDVIRTKAHVMDERYLDRQLYVGTFDVARPLALGLAT